jgi:hypothetical protein
MNQFQSSPQIIFEDEQNVAKPVCCYPKSFQTCLSYLLFIGQTPKLTPELTPERPPVPQPRSRGKPRLFIIVPERPKSFEVRAELLATCHWLC